MKLKRTACVMLAMIFLTARTSSYASAQYQAIRWTHPTTRIGGESLPVDKIKGTILYRDGARVGNGVIPRNVRSWVIFLPTTGCVSVQVSTVDTDGVEGAKSNAVEVCGR